MFAIDNYQLFIMIYISSDDKIMTIYYRDDNIREITNDTDFLPLHVRVHSNVILISNNKLYSINYYNLSLHEIVMKTVEDYIVTDPDDFTDGFAQINSKHYEIIEDILRGITIAAKDSHNIFITDGWCFYISIGGDLMCCRYRKIDTANNNSHLCCSGVDLILFCNYDKSDFKFNIICSCANKIIIHKFISVNDNITTCNINYNGASIIKIIGRFTLNSDGNLLELVSQHNYNMYYNVCITAIVARVSGVHDFNIVGDTIIYSNNKNEIYRYYTKYIGTGYTDIGYFKNRTSKVKSAASPQFFT